MNRRRIKEVIVVEGRHDSEKLKKYFDCDTIETGGSSLGKDVIELIRQAKEKRGVIIFTDPDSAGNRIRNTVNRQVPGCLNAFVDREKAHTAKKVGVEHAGYDSLYEALSNLMTYMPDGRGRLSMQDFYDLGLSGNRNSAQLREKAGRYYHIGGGNGRTMLNRMNCLGITRPQLEADAEKWKN